MSDKIFMLANDICNVLGLDFDDRGTERLLSDILGHLEGQAPGTVKVHAGSIKTIDDLRGPDGELIDLTGANLSGANLGDADLRGADLRDAARRHYSPRRKYEGD